MAFSFTLPFPDDFPRTLLHLLYAARSSAYLALPTPLPAHATGDAVECYWSNESYLPSHIRMHDGWKALGNMYRAEEAVAIGYNSAERAGDSEMQRTLAELRSRIPPVEEPQSTPYATPSVSSLPWLFPLLPAVPVNSSIPLLSSLASASNFQLASSPSLGRYLISTRDYEPGEVVLSEEPLYSGTMLEDVCASCWKPLRDGLAVVQCERRCGFELYCSVECREKRKRTHARICGRSWQTLKRKVAAGQSTSALFWLMVPTVMADFMEEVQLKVDDIQREAVRESLNEQPSTPSSPSSLSPSTSFNPFASLPLFHLFSGHDQLAAYNAQAQTRLCQHAAYDGRPEYVVLA